MAAQSSQGLAANKALQIATGGNLAPRRGYVVSIHFHDAGSFHNGRLLLPLGKALGPFPINVYPGKFLAVVIVNGDLPVLMLAPAVAMKPAGFTALFLFHRAHPPRDRKLWQFYKPRTSTELRVNFFNIIGRGERQSLILTSPLSGLMFHTAKLLLFWE